MSTLLHNLLQPAFALEIGTSLPPNIIRRNLLRSESVKTLRRAIEGGMISEGEIAEFVAALESEFQKGQRFPHEVAIAALAVVLEERKTDFVGDFYIDLCRLRKLREFEYAPEVAVLSSHAWTKVPSTKTLKQEYVPTTARFAKTMRQSVNLGASEANAVTRLRYAQLESTNATT